MHKTEAEPCSDEYWDACELWPRDRLREFQLTSLRRQLAYVYSSSPFYRKQWDEIGWNPADLQTLDALAHLPFTRKADYAAALAPRPPWGALLACAPEDVRRVHFSSGTTAQPTPNCWTAQDLDRWAGMYARYAYAQGVRRTDIFQCLFALAWFVGGQGTVAGYERLGAAVIPAGSADSKRQLETIARFGTTSICATPSYALHLAEVAREIGFDLAGASITKVMAGGEPGGAIPSTRRQIETLWGARCFDGYGSLEFQPIGWECEQQAGNHLAEDFLYAEVVDGEGRPVPLGQPGVLVLTHLDKQAFPLVRWWTGDVVVLDESRCACGRTHARLAGGVQGRADDMLIIRGVNLFPSAVEDIVRSSPGATGEYVIVLDDDVRDPSNGYLTGIKLRVEALPEVRQQLEGALKSLIRDRLSISAVVEVVEPGVLPRTTHKATRVVRSPSPLQGARTQPG